MARSERFLPNVLAVCGLGPGPDDRRRCSALNEGEVAMILSTVRIVLPARQLIEVMGLLAPMAQRTRTERGCLDCQLHRDLLEENVLVLEEKWATKVDLERHIRSEDYRQLLLIMELAKTAPEVRFDTVSGSEGFEAVARIRG